MGNLAWDHDRRAGDRHRGHPRRDAGRRDEGRAGARRWPFLRRSGRRLAGDGQVLRAGPEARGPAVGVDEGHLRASDDQEPGGVVRAGRGRGRGGPGRDTHPDPAAGSDPGPAGGAGQHAAVHRVRGAAAAVLPRLRLGGRARRRPGLRVDLGRQGPHRAIYLRSVVFGGAGFIVLCTLPILAKWVLIGRWKPAADPHLEPGLRPLLDRQDAGQVEPAGHPDRRLAAVRAGT